MKLLSMKVLSSLAAAGVVGFLIALFTAQHGCASNCGSNCPATTVYIGSTDNYQLPVAFDVYGPACPPESSVVCTGDESSTSCTHTTITGQAPSWCDVLVQFEPYVDGRPNQIIHLQFDQPYSAPGTCCDGYPVIGTSTYVIPDHPNGGGVYGLETVGDAAIKDYDAITTLHDAAAADAADAGTD
ncbi:MAG TPA: hypothetical protein VKZ18_19005 [Polyangia bacterium]|nr:hypothetical protein [Polyangia bacterium]